MGGGSCATPVEIGSLPFSDAGDTCGATNTVTNYGGTCTLPFSYAGEDEVYRMVVGAGNNVDFSATLGPAGDLALFLVTTCGNGATCVANSQDAIGPGAGPETIAATSYAPNTYFLYVDSYYDAGTTGSCGTYTLNVTGTLPVELLNFNAD
jgi:hypothetical protein